MVQIKSVRQSVPAPQEPILGGALQGFGAFANNMTAQKQQQQDQQNKLGLALLTAYAQQNRDIKPGSGPINFGGQKYSVGNKQLNPLDRKRSMDIGDESITPEYKRIKAENMAKEYLGKKWNWLQLSTSSNLKKRQEAQTQLDNLTALYMGESVDQGASSDKFDWKGAKKVLDTMKNVNPYYQIGEQSKKFFGKKTNAITKPNYLPGPDGNEIQVSQEDWDNASPEEQQALLNAYGL